MKYNNKIMLKNNRKIKEYQVNCIFVSNAAKFIHQKMVIKTLN